MLLVFIQCSRILDFLHTFIERQVDQFREVVWASFVLDLYTLKFYPCLWFLDSAGDMFYTVWNINVTVPPYRGPCLSSPLPHLQCICGQWLSSIHESPFHLRAFTVPQTSETLLQVFAQLTSHLLPSPVTSSDLVNNTFINQKEKALRSHQEILRPIIFALLASLY